MALTDEQKRKIGKKLGRLLFRNATATLNLDDLKAVCTFLDEFFDATPGQLNGTKTIKQNMVAGLPEPFASNTTAEQKWIVGALYFLENAGLLDSALG